MSLFVRQLSKLCLQARRASSCFFSSVPLSPYLMVDSGLWVETPNGAITKPRFLDPRKEEASQIVCGGEMLITDYFEFCVGASQGWTMISSLDSFHLTDGYKPWVSSPRCVPLPDTPHCMPRNELLSLSSSDPAEDDDCFVVTKFHDSMLSVCRTQDSKWTHIEGDCQGLINSVLPASTIAYSKRYEAFYFTTRQGFNLGSVDLSNTDNYKLKCHPLRLRNTPKNIEAKWKVLRKNCDWTNHLLDSPSGDLFYIMWFTKVEQVPSTDEDEDPDSIKLTRTGPKRFMVFRKDERSKDFIYTEDIEDLCIFLGKNEAFCVSASMYRGLRPNSIYYTYPHPIGGPGLGCYSLASARTRRLTSDVFIPHGFFWIQPDDPFGPFCLEQGILFA